MLLGYVSDIVLFCFISVVVVVFLYLKSRVKLFRRKISTGILFMHTTGFDPT
jgi:hypothetical protein